MFIQKSYFYHPSTVAFPMIVFFVSFLLSSLSVVLLLIYYFIQLHCLYQLQLVSVVVYLLLSFSVFFLCSCTELVFKKNTQTKHNSIVNMFTGRDCINQFYWCVNKTFTQLFLAYCEYEQQSLFSIHVTQSKISMHECKHGCLIIYLSRYDQQHCTH